MRVCVWVCEPVRDIVCGSQMFPRIMCRNVLLLVSKPAGTDPFGLSHKQYRVCWIRWTALVERLHQ